ncbi:helix-turn-helix domain-containing protein [Niabella aurantiaca]|uniref:helix-turn-helix domain-containing protein n=1 Tax=Niabella aurantiaca TaxID=379900 RepID=UPI0003664C95|nr:helix-turn-helix domain-containing protein [Niabella aurantiaca]
MQRMQILIPVDIDEFWKQMKILLGEVLLEKSVTCPDDQSDRNMKLIKIKDVCRLFQVSKPTIYDWMRKGQLRSVKIGSRRFFLASDIKELIANNSNSNH